MDDSDPRGRFFRERRLLLGISSVLLAHQLFGITVGKSAETLGLHFEIDDPSKLWWGVWLVWSWSAVCYVQQFNSIKPWTAYPKDRDLATRDRLSDWVAVRRVRRKALRYLRAHFPSELHPRFEFAGAGRVESSTSGQQRFLYMNVRVTARWSSDDPDSSAERAADFDRELEAYGWQASGGEISHARGTCAFSRIVNVRIIPIRDELGIRLEARAWTLASTSFLTDYFVPLAIGASPMIVAAVQALIRD